MTVAKKDFPTRLDIPGASEMPVGWGVYYGGGGLYEWGSSSKEAILRTGSKSVFLKLTRHYQDKAGKDQDCNAALIVGGEGNGFSSANTLPVKPGETYSFSFWIKGDAPAVAVCLGEWKTLDGKEERVIGGSTP